MTLLFGSSGIRGEYPEAVNPSVAQELALRATQELGKRLAVGYDSRWSGHALKAALTGAALEAGAELIDFELLPTPALSYETRSRDLDCGIMITASHNPPKYNGFKVFNSKGEAFDEEGTLAKLSDSKKTRANESQAKAVLSNCQNYEDALSKVELHQNWRVVIDPGNGAACQVAPRIYTRVLSKVTSINCVPEPDFSGRGSEPTPETMRLLCSAVRGTGSRAGVAFDGDADRTYIVDEKGNCPLQDRVLGAYISSMSRVSKGPFLVPIDISMAVDEVAMNQGAKIVRGPVGDAKLLREMNRVGGTFAGEPSGAWIHPAFNPCPDGLLSGLLFLQAIERDGRAVSEVVRDVPEYFMMRESISLTRENSKIDEEMIGREMSKVVGPDSRITTKFGLRVSSDQSWVLVRSSGTEPVLRVTAESKIRKDAGRILRDTLSILRRALKAVS